MDQVPTLKTRITPLSSSLPNIRRGSVLNDWGLLSQISDLEAENIRLKDPIATQYLRPIVSESNVYNQKPLWCLWLDGIDLAEVAASPELSQRIKQIEDKQRASKPTLQREDNLTRNAFQEIRQPRTEYMAVPISLGDNYEYLPVAHFEPQVIAHYKLGIIDNDFILAFGVISCKLFRVWKQEASNALFTKNKPGFGTIYNSFPLPMMNEEQKKIVAAGAHGVMQSRQYFLHNTLEELYQSSMKPRQLKTAHKELNQAVFPLFNLSPEADSETIMERLISYYKAMESQR